MNINAYQKGDLTISPTARYMVNGKDLNAKEFKEYIKGLEGDTNGEPETGNDTDSETKAADRPKRRSRTNTVRTDKTEDK